MEEIMLYINNTKIARDIRRSARNGKVIASLEKNVFTKYFLYRGSNKGKKFKSYHNVPPKRIKQNNYQAMLVKLDYIDLMICDAIYSLKNQGYDFFSPGSIVRTLSGDTEQTIRPEMRDEVNRRIKKLENININIKCLDEMKMRKVKSSSVNKGDFKGTFLSTMMESNKKMYCYMPLYGYGEIIKQYVKIPPKLLRLGIESGDKKPIRDTLENLAIKHYLIHRIEVANYIGVQRLDNMRKIYYYRLSHSKKPVPTGMMIDLGIVKKDTNREELLVRKKRFHKNVKIILEEFKKIGYIEGYEMIKDVGKEVKGIIIKDEIAKVDIYM